jgi:hypothetical protein
MKKFIKCFLFLFLFCLIFFLSKKKVSADYASDYQNYINKTGSYQITYNSYLVARSAYFAAQSLDSKDKAMKATLAMLQARDNLIVAYLNALKTKIQNTKGIDDANKISFGSLIDTEISWYNAHNLRLPSAGSLEDLVADSDEAKSQFNNSTLTLIYRSLVTLGVGNNSFIRGELRNEIILVQSKIDEIKANQDKDVGSIERLLIDVKNKLDRSEVKDADANNFINAIKPNDQQKENIFQDVEANLADSNSYLKEANQGLLQIITQIKSN